jgi:hypothetical protein
MQPKSPSPDFDFMLKSQPKQRRRLAMPNLPKPVLIGLAVLLVLILLIVVSSVMSGRKTDKFQPFVSALARDQETLRITSFAQQLQLRDPQTQAMAATAANALASDKQQMIDYLQKNGTKVSPAALGADNDKASDTSLQTAAQNNGLDAAYVAYMKTALGKYENDLKIAYVSSGPKGKQILADASASVMTLLNSPPLK